MTIHRGAEFLYLGRASSEQDSSAAISLTDWLTEDLIKLVYRSRIHETQEKRTGNKKLLSFLKVCIAWLDRVIMLSVIHSSSKISHSPIRSLIHRLVDRLYSSWVSTNLLSRRTRSNEIRKSSGNWSLVFVNVLVKSHDGHRVFRFNESSHSVDPAVLKILECL